MAFNKVTNTDISENQVQGAPDFPSGTAQQKKQIFDKLPLKIIERLNALMTKLESSAVDGGSANIGSAPIAGVDGSTILAQLQSLKEQLGEVVVGTIPDGTLSRAKFADFDSDAMSAQLEGYEEAESPADIMSTDSLVVALGKLQKTLNATFDSLQGYQEGVSSGEVVAKKAESVTTDLNGRLLTDIFDGGTNTVKQAKTAADQPQTDNSTNIANTKYVRQAISDAINIIDGGIGLYGSIPAPVEIMVRRQVNFVTIQLNWSIEGANIAASGTTNMIQLMNSKHIPKETKRGGAEVQIKTNTTGVGLVTVSVNTDGIISATVSGPVINAAIRSITFGYEITE